MSLLLKALPFSSLEAWLLHCHFSEVVESASEIVRPKSSVMCEKVVNISHTFCGAGNCQGNAPHTDLGNGGKLAQDLWEHWDAIPPELAG